MGALGTDIKRVLRLAVPVVFAELGWMAMTTVDTIMIGPLGPAAIGAIGVGSSAFYTFAIFGIGMLLGMDTLVSQAFGAGNREDCHRSLVQGFYLAIGQALPLTILFESMGPIFRLLGINPEVSALAAVFVRTLGWSILPLLLYGVLRRFLQATGHVKPVMFALVSANLINWFFNWLLIGGHWGFPALGVQGSALSTCMARVYTALVLGFCIWWFERGVKPGLAETSKRLDRARLGRLMRLGFPAATQILLEVAAFGAATVFAGRLRTADVAAHQIALNCASITFMVPLGIASAAAVAVGQAVGRRDAVEVRRNGNASIAIASVFMLCAAAAFLLLPREILRIYTGDRLVLEIGTGLLAIAALFQLFDGIQTVTTGALRGLGETKGPMLVNFGGYWLLGLPLGYVLCFQFGLGIYGVWFGLTLSLIAIASVLLWLWRRDSRKWAREELKEGRWSAEEIGRSSEL